MFTITKNARIHESVAADKFSQAERASMTKERGSNYYVWPFQVPILGCGNDVPSDYDQNGRTRFDRDAGYTVGDLQLDIEQLVTKHGLDLLVSAVNRGVDLELRADARPTPKAKMSDTDKACWVMANRKEVCAELLGHDDPIKAAARWYDENFTV